MVDQLCCFLTRGSASAGRVAGKMVVVAVFGWMSTQIASAQEPGVHYYHQGVMPPGAIGSLQLQRGGPVRGFFQPVEIKAPQGVLISLVEGGAFEPPQPTPYKVGLLIGQVYRLRVTNVPLYQGLEVFPTIEVVDRLYAPPDQMWRFPIEIQLALEDLVLALDGKFVTRVIYLEDPLLALPVRKDPGRQEWFEAAPGTDPLAVADQLGRPVAILRLGARLPGRTPGADRDFFFGSPPLARYAGGPNQTPQPVEPQSSGETQARLSGRQTR
jgi:hypothetical protein